jgi:hypothetical protein
MSRQVVVIVGRRIGHSKELMNLAPKGGNVAATRGLTVTRLSAHNNTPVATGLILRPIGRSRRHPGYH